MKTILTILAIVLFTSCNSQENKGKSTNAENNEQPFTNSVAENLTFINLKILNKIPIGWGVKYKCINLSASSAENDTIILSIATEKMKEFDLQPNNIYKLGFEKISETKFLNRTTGFLYNDKVWKLKSISEQPISIIKFDLQHPLRITDHKVSIELKKQGNKDVLVHLISIPLIVSQGQDIIEKSIDTTFFIENTRFLKIQELLPKLSGIDNKKAKASGKDGTVCKLQFGTIEYKTTYEYWSPDYNTTERGLDDFLHICYKIIKTANLQPEVIL